LWIEEGDAHSANNAANNAASDAASDTDDAGPNPDASACPQGQRLCGTACVDTNTSADHCGGCNSPCAGFDEHSPAQCQQGSCERTCAPGWSDADENWRNTSGATTNGCELECTPTSNPAEACDGIDNDCDGVVDEGVTIKYYLDKDGDGYGIATDFDDLCAPEGDYRSTRDGDCNDENDQIHPTAEDVCNGVDDDCDGTIDPGCSCVNGETLPCYSGSPSTRGTGLCQDGTATCTAGSLGSCDGEITPAAESCDGADNDCDGETDEDFADKGDACSDGMGICRRTGTMVCTSNGADTECSVTAGSPDAAESCGDGLDNNCNGRIDDGCQCNFGGDPHGVCHSGVLYELGNCQEPAAYESSETLCDGVDNDCDDDVDEGLKTTYYADADGDGFPDLSSTTTACTQPAGYIPSRGDGREDCDDGDPFTYPGATEICDDKDNNCDTTIDDDGGTSANNWCASHFSDNALGCKDFGPGDTLCCEADSDGGTDCDYESVCHNGVDDDGDGGTDCADMDCDGLYCAPGKVCQSQSCQPIP
jgi:hypothetical protein